MPLGRSQELESKIKVKSESQLRNEASNREKKVVDGMAEKYHWELGEVRGV